MLVCDKLVSVDFIQGDIVFSSNISSVTAFRNSRGDVLVAAGLSGAFFIIDLNTGKIVKKVVHESFGNWTFHNIQVVKSINCLISEHYCFPFLIHFEEDYRVEYGIAGEEDEFECGMGESTIAFINEDVICWKRRTEPQGICFYHLPSRKPFEESLPLNKKEYVFSDLEDQKGMLVATTDFEIVVFKYNYCNFKLDEIIICEKHYFKEQIYSFCLDKKKPGRFCLTTENEELYVVDDIFNKNSTRRRVQLHGNVKYMFGLDCLLACRTEKDEKISFYGQLILREEEEEQQQQLKFEFKRFIIPNNDDEKIEKLASLDEWCMFENGGIIMTKLENTDGTEDNHYSVLSFQRKFDHSIFDPDLEDRIYFLKEIESNKEFLDRVQIITIKFYGFESTVMKILF